MLYTLGLDSEFALLETVLTGFYDMFPRTRRYKTWLTLGACVVCFLISIPCFSLSGSGRRDSAIVIQSTAMFLLQDVPSAYETGFG